MRCVWGGILGTGHSRGRARGRRSDSKDVDSPLLRAAITHVSSCLPSSVSHLTWFPSVIIRWQGLLAGLDFKRHFETRGDHLAEKNDLNSIPHSALILFQLKWSSNEKCPPEMKPRWTVHLIPQMWAPIPKADLEMTPPNLISSDKGRIVFVNRPCEGRERDGLKNGAASRSLSVFTPLFYGSGEQCLRYDDEEETSRLISV